MNTILPKKKTLFSKTPDSNYPKEGHTSGKHLSNKNNINWNQIGYILIHKRYGNGISGVKTYLDAVWSIPGAKLT